MGGDQAEGPQPPVARAEMEPEAGLWVGAEPEPGVPSLLGTPGGLPGCQMGVFKLGFCGLQRSCFIQQCICTPLTQSRGRGKLGQP